MVRRKREKGERLAAYMVELSVSLARPMTMQTSEVAVSTNHSSATTKYGQAALALLSLLT